MYWLGRTLIIFRVDHHWRTSTLKSHGDHLLTILLKFIKYKFLTLCVGAKICLRRRSWSRGSHGRHRDLQRKSKPEVGLLRQDPPMLKSVLCLNKNGVVAPRLILMITKQIEGIQIFLFEKVFMLFKGKIIILLKS